MNLTRRSFSAALGGLLTLYAVRRVSAQTASVTHEVKMLNKATDDPKTIMVFEPDFVRAAPGDKIKFLVTDKSHSVNSMKGLIPETAALVKSAINEEIEVELTVEGAYAFQCTPHMGMGMVMLVLVGDVESNYAAVKEFKFKGKAKDRFADIFARADEALANEAAAG